MNRLPNLFIIGVPKAGTTSIFEYLGQHPDVFPSPVKQPGVFKGAVDPPTLVAYAELFRHARSETYALEATPGYFGYGRETALRIATTLPAARAIVSLRDPVQRLLSHHEMLVRSGLLTPEEERFDTFVEPLVTDRVVPGTRLEVLDRATRYGPLLRAWDDVLGDRLLVVFFDDLVRDPRAVTERVCRWLHIDTRVCADLDYRVRNQRTRYRNPALARTVRRVARMASPAVPRDARLRAALRHLHGRVNTVPAPERQVPEERTIQGLQSRYADSNGELRAWLAEHGYRMPGWLEGLQPAEVSQ